MRKPVAVTRILLMDQRFWGCASTRAAPSRKHRRVPAAVEWADRALDPDSDYSRAAAALDFGDEEEDGVAANARMFATIVDAGLPPEP